MTKKKSKIKKKKRRLEAKAIANGTQNKKGSDALRAGTKAKLQEILFDYPYYDAQIERLEDCKKRDVMIERKEAITRLLNKSGNDSLRDAIRLYYFSKPRRYTWQGVAFECGMHPSQLSRAHTDFLHKLARELGEM